MSGISMCYQERGAGRRRLEGAESNFDRLRVMNRSTVRSLALMRSGKSCLTVVCKQDGVADVASQGV